MKRRPYQDLALSAIVRELECNASTLLVMATGCGKTVIFSHLAHEWKTGRVLIVAHRDELIRQAADKIKQVTGDECGIEMGTERVEENAFTRPRIVVTSVQTMCRPKRQEKFRPEEFGLIVIDEAHHAVASTYKSVVEYFRQGNPKIKLVGVTATPKRGDDLALGQVFDSLAYEYGIVQAVDDGWLVPVHQRAVHVHDLDFSKVRTTAGDLNEGDLERILMEEKIAHRIAAPTIEIVGDRSALLFCVSVAHSKLMAEILNRHKDRCAQHLDGESSKEERRKVVNAFRSGQLQYLANCGLFLEGFDAPNTAVVVMGRPTKSLTLYTQVLGRGTRPLPGVVDGLESAADRTNAIASSPKPFMLALDFVGNSGRHKIITAADVLGGKYAEPVRQYARKTLEEEQQPASVNESLERAKDEMEFLETYKERMRRKAITAKAEYTAREVSPFEYGGGGPMTDTRDATRTNAPTPKQVGLLVHLGVDRKTAVGYSQRQASAVIGKLMAERNK